MFLKIIWESMKLKIKISLPGDGLDKVLAYKK